MSANKQKTLTAATLKRMAKDYRVKARFAEKRAKASVGLATWAVYRAIADNHWASSEIHDTEAKRLAKMR